MHPAITRIRSALKQEIFTSGICKVPVEYCDLYYPSSSSETFNRLNLTTATEKQLAKLIAVCDAAPFGRGDQTVLDTSYRKALKLDLSQFSMPFELANTSVIPKIQQDLVETDSVLRRRIRAEPYKLNIYDHGAFFKAHQDTPRAGNMFGSLVVIFPTPHEGGTLVLSTETEQWSFDAHTMLAASNSDAPHIAYVAFYSDITHEVLPVTSGCRITLTYNLYFEDIIDTSGVAWPASDRYDVVRNALKELVDDESAFPAEGILGFGLMHQYSINRYDEDNGTSYNLSELPKFLKDSDALVYSVCKDLGLDVTLQALYKTEGRDFRKKSRYHDYYLTPNFIKEWSYEESDDVYRGLDNVFCSDKQNNRLIVITKMLKSSRVRSCFLTYGNEPSLDWVYAAIWLVAQRSV